MHFCKRSACTLVTICTTCNILLDGIMSATDLDKQQRVQSTLARVLSPDCMGVIASRRGSRRLIELHWLPIHAQPCLLGHDACVLTLCYASNQRTWLNLTATIRPTREHYDPSSNSDVDDPIEPERNFRSVGPSATFSIRFGHDAEQYSRRQTGRKIWLIYRKHLQTFQFKKFNCR